MRSSGTNYNMKHEYLSCDKCGYTQENAGCIIKSFITNNDDEKCIDLCDDCVVRYKLENPTVKIYVEF